MIRGCFQEKKLFILIMLSLRICFAFNFFFLEIEFCEEKVNAASLNVEFQKQIMSIVKRVQEVVF